MCKHGLGDPRTPTGEDDTRWPMRSRRVPETALGTRKGTTLLYLPSHSCSLRDSLTLPLFRFGVCSHGTHFGGSDSRTRVRWPHTRHPSRLLLPANYFRRCQALFRKAHPSSFEFPTRQCIIVLPPSVGRHDHYTCSSAASLQKRSGKISTEYIRIYAMGGTARRETIQSTLEFTKKSSETQHCHEVRAKL